MRQDRIGKAALRLRRKLESHFSVQSALAALAKGAASAFLPLAVPPFWWTALRGTSHLLYRPHKIGSQMLIEFYLMLQLVGVNQYSIGHSHIVFLFYQKAVCSELEHVAPMRLYCPAAFDLNRDHAAFTIPDDIIRLAG